MSTNTLTVSAGRNVGTEPMEMSQWAKFQDEIIRCAGDAIDRNGPSARHYGTVAWDGVAEDSVIISFWDLPTIDAETRVTIENRLLALARKYGQDAIAYTIGETHMAER